MHPNKDVHVRCVGSSEKNARSYSKKPLNREILKLEALKDLVKSLRIRILKKRYKRCFKYLGYIECLKSRWDKNRPMKELLTPCPPDLEHMCWYKWEFKKVILPDLMRID